MSLSWHSMGTYPEMSSHVTLSGNIRPQSSQPAEPLWIDPGLKSGIGVHELISTKNKQTKTNKQTTTTKTRRRREMNGRTFSQIPCKRVKSHHVPVRIFSP